MAKKTAEERRSAVRAKRVLSIQYRLVKCRRKNFDKSWYLSTTQDMSINGVSFYSNKELSKGDVLEIHIVMSGMLDIYNGFSKVVRIVQQNAKNYYLIAVKILDKKPKKKTASSKNPKTSSTNKKKK